MQADLASGLWILPPPGVGITQRKSSDRGALLEWLYWLGRRPVAGRVGLMPIYQYHCSLVGKLAVLTNNKSTPGDASWPAPASNSSSQACTQISMTSAAARIRLPTRRHWRGATALKLAVVHKPRCPSIENSMRFAQTGTVWVTLPCALEARGSHPGTLPWPRVNGDLEHPPFRLPPAGRYCLTHANPQLANNR